MIRTTRNPMLGSASFWTQDLSIIGFKTKTLSELVSDMFKNGEQGFFYDPSSLTYGTYGVEQTSAGIPVTVGVADAAEYDNSLHTGHVYRADQYNQSIVNFDVNNSLTHEIVIENTGSTTIAVNADLAMGTVLFTVAAGQRVTRLIAPVQVIVITSANNISTAYFKIHSLKEFSGSYTMYQDAAGTIPVTGAGQPVGLMLDKSGRNNHASQTTSSSRPILRQNATTGMYYLEFDGSDDFLVTNSINFTATDKISLFAGVRKLSDTSIRVIAELGVSADGGGNNGTFAIKAPTTSGLATYGGTLNGTTPRQFIASGFTAPHSTVLTSQLAVSAATILGAIKLRINGVQQTLTGGGVWTPRTSFNNYPLYIGRRGGTSLPFNGHVYSLIGVGRLTTESETVAIEKELAKRTGVTLSV